MIPRVLCWVGVACGITAAFWQGNMVIGFGATGVILILAGALEADRARLEEHKKKREQDAMAERMFWENRREQKTKEHTP
jgi:hypothetical protein